MVRLALYFGVLFLPFSAAFAQVSPAIQMTDIVTIAIIQTVFLSLIFGGFLWVIVRGIDKILDYQKNISDLGDKEQQLKTREMKVMTTMIESELKANLSKINAHITIYKEMLSELQRNTKAARYQKMGDIYQKQPALQRTIFETNAHHLQILGEQLASRIIHFYARIKTEPDFENIEPTQSPDSVIIILEKIIENGIKLELQAQGILEDFQNI